MSPMYTGSLGSLYESEIMESNGEIYNEPEETKNTVTTTTSSLLLVHSNLVSAQPSGFALTSPLQVKNRPVNSQAGNLSDDQNEYCLMNNISHQQTKSNDQAYISKTSESLYQSTRSSEPSNSFSITSQPYKEINYHWFYQKDPEHHPNDWQAFSMLDNSKLEAAFLQGRLDEMIPTNGTRFDVRISDRIRTPVYWQGPQGSVRRCSWFYKVDYQVVPYSEHVADLLETTYRDCAMTSKWNRRLNLTDSEFVIFYDHNSVYHYFNGTVRSSEWPILTSTDIDSQPRYAYRGPSIIETKPERDEPSISVQHLIFFVHGVGEFCDLSFRPLKDVVDDFRTITNNLVQTHYGPTTGHVEVLPISWHWALHTKSLDERLHEITLPSISRLRSFTNDTILDALFYTSPIHSMTLLNFVATELNRLYGLFLQRNPHFTGRVALAGHSLGSLILFDLLSYQRPNNQQDSQQNQVEQIHFQPECLFALGSPLAAFLTIRGTQLDQDFRLPTCPGFYNIFHPYDPIAYRLEPLINREFVKLKPVLIPHHKGRKRIHLELKDLKQKLMSGLKGALNSIYGFARFHYEDGDSQQEQKQEMNIAADIEPAVDQHDSISNLVSINENSITEIATADVTETDINKISSLNFGLLNRGRRLDYVLQERPIEIVNEYVFAITSHGCYWLSEDTSLLMLRELFGVPKITVAHRQPSSDQ